MTLSPNCIAARLLASLVLMLAALAAAAQSSERTVTQGLNSYSIAPVPQWVARIPTPSALTQPATPAAPATILLADTQLSALAGQSSYYVHRVIQVSTSAVLAEIGQVQMQYASTYQRLAIHRLRVVRDGKATDRLESANIKLIEREVELEAKVYTGLVTAVALVDDLRVGDLLEYEYTISGQNPVFGGKFVHWVGYADQFPIVQRQVRLLAPDGRGIRYASTGGAIASPTERVSNGLRETLWRGHDVPVPRHEDRMPIHHFAFPLIGFSEFDGWPEVARWTRDLYEANTASPAELDTLIARFGRADGPAADRIAAALDFVQKEIRYFAVALGESSHRPSPAASVLSRRYGDCKDKTALLIALLQRMGFKAAPALVSTQFGRGVDELLPSPLAFDHVITRLDLDGVTYWLDGTLSHQSGRLIARSQPTYLGKALVAADVGGGLVAVLPVPNGARDRTEVEEIFVAPTFDKPTEMTIISTRTGRNAESARAFVASRSKADLERDFLGDVTRKYPKATVIAPLEISDDTAANVLRIRERYLVPEFLQERGGRWFGEAYPSILSGALELPQVINRSTPLALNNPFEYVYRYRMELPASISANLDPFGRRIENSAVQFDEAFNFRGNVASGQLEFRTRSDEVTVANSEAYIADLRRIRQRLLQGVTFTRNAQTPVAMTIAPGGEVAARYRAQIEKSIAEISRRIDDGSLKGADLVRAITERASAFKEIERLDAAGEDVRRAIALDRRHSSAYLVRGNIAISAGEFDKAVADFSQALALGAEVPVEVYKSRGLAHFYAGRYARAAEDFRRSVELSSDTGDSIFASLWHAWALRRAGKALPEAMVVEFNERAHGPWPRPALGLLTGRTTPEEVLAAADSKSAEERLLNLCEAYFYLGQHAYLGGDRQKAREYFGKARATGVIVYVEYEMAKHELAALGAP